MNLSPGSTNAINPLQGLTCVCRIDEQEFYQHVCDRSKQFKL
jgi:hypothetical protein